MNLGRLSINQPILAMVLSIVLLIVGAIAYPDAAGLGISAGRAADRYRHHAISGRLGADRIRHRRRPDRAGDQRRRGHAVSLQPGDLERPAHHHRHLQARHRPRQGAGAGAEPRRDRAAAAARGGAAQRRRHPQELARHPDGRVHAVARRHVRSALHLQLHVAAGPRSAFAARRRRRHPDVRRARLLDAVVARSRPDRQCRSDIERGAGSDPRAEPADHGRTDRGAADCRSRIPAEPRLHWPPQRYQAVRGHRGEGRLRRPYRAAARRRPRRARCAVLRHQQPHTAQVGRRNGGDATARIERARHREANLRHDGAAQDELPEGARLQYRLQPHRIHRPIGP